MSLYKQPITPIRSYGSPSVPLVKTYGTHISVLGVGGYQEIYSLSELIYTIPSGTTGDIEYSANTIPVTFRVGTGSPFHQIF